jgi:phenylpyruvate tautomerase PptA (4-oxalocrotonate tautomerase family)
MVLLYDECHNLDADGSIDMPMIDVSLPADLLPAGADAALAEELAAALLRAEGAPLAEPYLSNTGVYVHRLEPTAVHTAAGAGARTVRVEVLTPPGALTRDGQRELVRAATRIVAEHVGDPSQAERTWVLLREAAEGGWGALGVALGAEEFAALRSARTADA